MPKSDYTHVLPFPWTLERSAVPALVISTAQAAESAVDVLLTLPVGAAQSYCAHWSQLAMNKNHNVYTNKYGIVLRYWS